MGFAGSSNGKESACSVRDLGSIPGWGRSPGEGNGYPLQYSCLENSMDRGAWWATVRGSQRVGHNGVTHTHARSLGCKNGQCICFIFLAGCGTVHRGHKESETTECALMRTCFTFGRLCLYLEGKFRQRINFIGLQLSNSGGYRFLWC